MPVAEELSDFSSEDLVAYVARVSNPNNQMNTETSAKLIAYCVKNKHWSILEHCFATVEITTSCAIAAQILRHRSMTFQQFSQRYAKAEELEIYEARRQDIKNRQNSIDDLTPEQKQWFLDAQKDLWKEAYDAYKEAISQGIAKECARFLLPQGTQTKLYMSGSLRSWVHYIDLRSKPGTQKEHMDIAEAIKGIFITEFPTVSEAMGWTQSLS